MGPCVVIAAFIPPLRAILPDSDNNSMMLIFGIGMTILFGVAIIEHLSKSKNDLALLRTIKTAPEQIIWVYKEVSSAYVQKYPGRRGSKVAQFTHVHFHLADKTKVKIWLAEQEADHLLHLMSNEFPNLSVGYNQSIKETYKKDPMLLSQNPQRVTEVKQTGSGVRL